MAELKRKLTLLGVIFLALCSVIGGGINVLLIEVQKFTYIGNNITLAIILGGIMALFISLVYANLSYLYPLAGGEYIYVSRIVSTKWGFIISFLKWISAIVALGTVAYMDSFIAATALKFIGLVNISEFLSTNIGAVIFGLIILWIFYLTNYFGLEILEKTVITLAILMISGGLFVSWVGLTHSHSDFIAKLNITSLPNVEENSSFESLLQTAIIMFWAYIGFTTLAQTGSEIRDPKKNLPLAFILTSIIITLYYSFYSYAFYHAVPWQYVIDKPNGNVAEFIGYLLPQHLAFIISLIIFIALANDIPPFIYTKSRLVYAWAKDGILPKIFAKLNKYHVPHYALLFITVLASLVVILNGLTSIITEVNVTVNTRFLLYAIVSFSLIKASLENKEMFIKNPKITLMLGVFGFILSLVLFGYISFIDINDIITGKKLWFHSSTLQLILIGIAGIVFFNKIDKKLKNRT